MKQLTAILVTALLFTVQATAQHKVKPFGILQVLMTKYQADADGSFGGSLSGGVLLKQRWGVGLNVQAFYGHNSKKYYLPVNFEASYFTQKKFSPYFNVQIGKGIYQRTTKYNFESGPGSDRYRGGYYFSPGAGIFLPFFGKSKVILTAAYVRSQFKRRFIEAANPSTPRYESSTKDGYKVGIGFKL